MGIKKYDTHPTTLVDNQNIEGCLKKWTMFTNVSPINAIYIFIYLKFLLARLPLKNKMAKINL
jgi:hypothetical protein